MTASNAPSRALLLLALCGAALSGCDTLAVEPPSEFSQAFLETESGMRAVLNSAYEKIQYNSADGAEIIRAAETSTDVMLSFRGALNRGLRFFEQHTWDGSHGYIEGAMWTRPYTAIRDAHVILENVEANRELSAQEKTVFAGEARFIRALAYVLLYDWFGPVPLRTSSTDDPLEPRATDEEMLEFIETELLAAAEALPVVAADFGRATRGAALGVLAKHYLNTRQWQKAADMSKRVIDMGVYSLWPDFLTLFSVENEGNPEMIWVWAAYAKVGRGNISLSAEYPPLYPNPIGLNTAAQAVLPMPMYRNFEPGDIREKQILTEYVNENGQRINLLVGNEFRHPRVFKYPPDANVDIRDHGNDIPYLRYADILLTRAEALNMVQGPNAESLERLNQVRRRAGLKDLTLAQVPSRDALTDAILKERALEFLREGKRREDLIRHDRFIQNALDRGVATEPFRVRFPLPQVEIDANPNLEQNPGY